jgi:hypothetical protein
MESPDAASLLESRLIHNEGPHLGGSSDKVKDDGAIEEIYPSGLSDTGSGILIVVP